MSNARWKLALFDDEDGPVRTLIVTPRSQFAQRKASSKRTHGGLHSFRSLLDDLSTRNRVRTAGVQEMTPTPLQEKTLKLLNVRRRRG